MPLRPQFLVGAVLAVIGLEGAYIAHRVWSPAAEAESAPATPYATAGVDDDFFTSSIKVINNGEGYQPIPPPLDQVAQADTTPPPAEPGLPQMVPPLRAPVPAATVTPAPTPVATPAAAPVQAPAPAAAPPPVAAATPAPAQPAQPAVDETALRYFARQGDDRRLNAEIARLKLLYPDWTPPDNFNAPAPISDPALDQMWKLYGDGQYAAVRAAIADRIGREPQWPPPADLLKRLDVGEARERLINASNAKQWNTVVAVAAATPSLLTCADVDVLWRVAEAFGMSDRTPRSLDVDTYILSNCQNPKERLATVQKAMAVLDDGQIDTLMKMERKGNDGQGEFQPVKADIARRRIGASARDPKLVVPQEDIDLLAQLARDGTTANDPLLLGEYWFSHQDPAKAVDWFAMAKSRADNAEISRGYAFALNALNRPGDGEEIAYKWRDATDDNKNAYLVCATSLLSIDPPVRLDPEILKRMSAVISNAKYGPGAQELGWYAYKIGQVPIAVRWFGMAESLMPDDEPSAFGLALSYDRLKDRGGLTKVLRAWAARSPRIADLANPPNRRRIVTDARGAIPPAAQNIGLAPGAPGYQTIPPGSAYQPAPANTAYQNAPTYQPAPNTPAYQPAPLAQQGAGARQVQAQSYQTPAYQTPAYQAPTYQAPAYRAPVYQAPAYQDEADQGDAQPAPARVSRPQPRVRREQADYAAAPAQTAPRAEPRRVANTAPAAGSNGRPSCSTTTRPEQLSAMNALNRGWCLMSLNRPIEAADAFDAAVKSGTGQVSQDAAYGKTLAYLRAGLTASAAASAAESPQSTKRSVELRTEILTQRAIASYNDDRFVETLMALDARAQIAPEQNDLLMMRGWCYFHLRRYPEAKRIWVAVAGTGSRDAQRALATLNDQTKVQ